MSLDKLTSHPKIMVLLLVVVAVALLVIFFRYKWLRRSIRRQKQKQRELSQRRYIRSSDKEAVFERDNYTCQICGISRDFLEDLCPGLGDYLLLEADHIRSVKRGGSGDDIDNLQCLCWRCNRKKGGNKTNQEVQDEINYGIWYLKE
ncbi:MAG: HNH endonuclease [Saccharofermentans sp.]|nr:HNH endonuclease [Saccharofermentans sp.]